MIHGNAYVQLLYKVEPIHKTLCLNNGGKRGETNHGLCAYVAHGYERKKNTSLGVSSNRSYKSGCYNKYGYEEEQDHNVYFQVRT